VCPSKNPECNKNYRYLRCETPMKSFLSEAAGHLQNHNAALQLLYFALNNAVDKLKAFCG
jgi:hypothetical protein